MKEMAALAVFAALLIGLVFVVAPKTYQRVNRLTNDFQVLSHSLESEEMYSQDLNRQAINEAREQGGSLSLVSRTRLWQSAIQMLRDSYGAGVGAGSYYRLSGFPRYQVMPMRENAHMFWLQLLAEAGIIVLFTIAVFFIVPFWIVWSSSLSPEHKWLALGFLVFAFCNIAGQSLLQQEILWLTGILIGSVFVGNIPVFLQKSISSASVKFLTFVATIFLIYQVTAWTTSHAATDELGWLISAKSEIGGYFFDNDGHRYLQVGALLKETILIPAQKNNLEFRVRSPESQSDNDNSGSQKITALALDRHNRLIATNAFELAAEQGINSLNLSLNNFHGDERITIILLAEQAQVHGNLFKSAERKRIGFYYYGYWIHINNK